MLKIGVMIVSLQLQFTIAVRDDLYVINPLRIRVQSMQLGKSEQSCRLHSECDSDGGVSHKGVGGRKLKINGFHLLAK